MIFFDRPTQWCTDVVVENEDSARVVVSGGRWLEVKSREPNEEIQRRDLLPPTTISPFIMTPAHL
jgi:hypothetical protein